MRSHSKSEASESGVFINGIGHISPMGVGQKSLPPVGLRPAQRQLSHLSISTSTGEVSLPHFRCPDFRLPESVPDGVKRRMPRISALFFAAVFEAAEEAFGSGMSILKENPQRVGIIVGTAFGSLSTALAYERRIILEGPVGASPTLFTGSVQNAIASHLSIALGIQGPSTTITTLGLTATNSIQMARDWIDQDIVDHVIVAIGDELSDLHLYSLADQIQRFPWVQPGEGVVSLVLSREPLPHVRSVRIERQISQARELPLTDRCFLSPWDGHHQIDAFSALAEHQILSRKRSAPQSFHEFYGHQPTGLGFELAIAISWIRSDRTPTACLQIDRSMHIDSIVLA